MLSSALLLARRIRFVSQAAACFSSFSSEGASSTKQSLTLRFSSPFRLTGTGQAQELRQSFLMPACCHGFSSTTSNEPSSDASSSKRINSEDSKEDTSSEDTSSSSSSDTSDSDSDSDSDLDSDSEDVKKVSGHDSSTLGAVAKGGLAGIDGAATSSTGSALKSAVNPDSKKAHTYSTGNLEKSVSKKAQSTENRVPSDSKKAHSSGGHVKSDSKKAHSTGGHVDSDSKKVHSTGGQVKSESKKAHSTGGQADSDSKKSDSTRGNVDSDSKKSDSIGANVDSDSNKAHSTGGHVKSDFTISSAANNPVASDSTKVLAVETKPIKMVAATQPCQPILSETTTRYLNQFTAALSSADKSQTYKNTEYFAFDGMSFYDYELVLEGKRMPQPKSGLTDF